MKSKIYYAQTLLAVFLLIVQQTTAQSTITVVNTPATSGVANTIYAESNGSNGNTAAIYGVATGAFNNIAIVGNATYGSNYNVGVQGFATNAYVSGLGMYAVSQNATSSNYGIYASAYGGAYNYAGYFDGDVYTTGSYLPSDESLKNNI